MRLILLLALLGAAVLPLAGLSVEVGVTGGGGMALMYGSLMDDKTQTVALLGSASAGSLGYSQFLFFPAWTVGLYGEMPIIDWLSLRLDAWYETAGAARTGYMSTGSPFDVYGAYFASVDIPLRARVHFPLGPGTISGTLGPYLGIIAGDVSLVDRFSSATSSVAVTPDLAHRFFFGIVGGPAYSMRLGPGIATVEIRADWAILSANASGQQGGDLNPIDLTLVAGYGIQLGDRR